MPPNPFGSFDYQNPYQLPSSAASVIPKELGQDFLSTLDKNFQVSENNQLNDLYGNMEGRGLFNSGETLRQALSQVLGPGQQRRQGALTQLALGGAQIGQGQMFQKQMENTMFQHKLQEMQEQYSIQAQLMTLQRQLMPSSGSGGFLSNIMGQALPLAGMAGGAAIGGAGGAGVGGMLGGLASKLFSHGSDSSSQYSTGGD